MIYALAYQYPIPGVSGFGWVLVAAGFVADMARGSAAASRPASASRTPDPGTPEADRRRRPSSALAGQDVESVVTDPAIGE